MLDYKLEDFYVPDMKHSSPELATSMNKINIYHQQPEFSKKLLSASHFDIFSMTLSHVRDFVGQHHDLVQQSVKLSLKKGGQHKGGLMITDFIVN